MCQRRQINHLSDPYSQSMRCIVSFTDHQLSRHGGRHIQEAGEGPRLLSDCCERGELEDVGVGIRDLSQ